MVKSTDRVRIWNSFFKLAWTEARSVHETSSGSEYPTEFDPLGGTLNSKQNHILAAMVLCNLAIEARANHLLEELMEKGKISPSESDAARHLSTKHKWFLLPKLAGVAKRLDDASPPHQAISQICSLRNNLLHVDYVGIQKQLPSPDAALSLFAQFVEAMEDMNVVLGRHKKHQKEVLKWGKF